MIDLSKVKAILRPRLELHEGVRLKPYRDTNNFLSIGVGRCLDKKGISREEADILLSNDMVECIDFVRKNLPWSVKFDDERFSVLVEMAFQMGGGGLLLFEKFLKLMELGNYKGAALEMLNSKWGREDSPKRALKLSDIIRGG